MNLLKPITLIVNRPDFISGFFNADVIHTFDYRDLEFAIVKFLLNELHVNNNIIVNSDFIDDVSQTIAETIINMGLSELTDDELYIKLNQYLTANITSVITYMTHLTNAFVSVSKLLKDFNREIEGIRIKDHVNENDLFLEIYDVKSDLFY